MSAELKSEILTVRSLLSLTDLTIPIYQRPYKWTSDNVSQLFQDLDALQQRLAKTQQLKQGMMQELLTGKTRLVIV